MGCCIWKADLLNRCKVAAKSILLTCSRPCSHISWYNTIWFLLPCGCTWIAFWKNRHRNVFTRKGTAIVDSRTYSHTFVSRGKLRALEQSWKEVEGSWGKKEKKLFLYSAEGPGRMAQTPQAGTGDSVSRFRRSRCSTLVNYISYFLVGGQFCIQP